MRRRDFIKAIIGSAAGWPCVAHAQTSEGMRRVAVLIGVADDPQGRARFVAFRDGMDSLGWIEGRNVHFEVRFAEGRPELSLSYASEIVTLSPDVIVANGAGAIRALQQLTKTIPIVFAQVVDPVNAGFVESLARPGGNTTGFTSVDYSIGTKWLETLKEIAPKVNRVGVLRDPTIPAGSGQLGATAAPPQFLARQQLRCDRARVGHHRPRYQQFAREPNGGMICARKPAFDRCTAN
jgi:putative ABC transport system substrate-binding protein